MGVIARSYLHTHNIGKQLTQQVLNTYWANKQMHGEIIKQLFVYINHSRQLHSELKTENSPDVLQGVNRYTVVMHLVHRKTIGPKKE